MTAKYSKKLVGKRVVVIGGTSGIGFCVAEACVEFGAIVTVASSRQEKIDKTIDRLVASYPSAKERISGHVIDLSSPDIEDALHTLFKAASTNGKIDHVVHTASDSSESLKITQTDSETIRKYGEVRDVSVVYVAKVAPQYMHLSASSSITITGGVTGRKPVPGWSVVAGWQAAKEGLARALAVELRPIRVNLVSPGVIDTELFDKRTDGVFATKEAMLAAYGSKSLLQKCGSPEDTAEAYLYFMRDTYVTGHVLVTDGGYLLN